MWHYQPGFQSLYLRANKHGIPRITTPRPLHRARTYVPNVIPTCFIYVKSRLRRTFLCKVAQPLSEPSKRCKPSRCNVTHAFDSYPLCRAEKPPDFDSGAPSLCRLGKDKPSYTQQEKTPVTMVLFSHRQPPERTIVYMIGGMITFG